MSRKKREHPILEGIEITGLAAEGKALAKVKIKDTDESPIVVFVPYGIPGDIVSLKIEKKKHNYAEGRILEIVKPSPIRQDPKCRHFGTCGGCKWQHLPYGEQLKYKRQQVVDALERIAKVEFPTVRPILGADSIWGYRNKMEYTFSNKRWRTWEEIQVGAEGSDHPNALGFHIPGSFDKVLHIDQCHLQDGMGDRIRNFLFDYANENGLSFYDIKENKGLLRTLIIRPFMSGELMVCVVFGEDSKEEIADILTNLKNKFPKITSLLYVVNLKVNDSITDREINVFSGSEYVEEKMGELKFRISGKSFYQTNSRQAEKLYEKVGEFAGLFGHQEEEPMKPLIYDLYTGTGTIANYVAKKSRKVIGIEYVEDAIRDAKINSEINDIDNTEFYAGDMKNVLTSEFIEQHGHPDIMIVDPPRAGMHEDVVKVILQAEPPVLIYVSCNPATQARDVGLLNKKYKVTDVQPVDMFPHTHHVENIVRLELRATEDQKRNEQDF